MEQEQNILDDFMEPEEKDLLWHDSAAFCMLAVILLPIFLFMVLWNWFDSLTPTKPKEDI